MHPRPSDSVKETCESAGPEKSLLPAEGCAADLKSDDGKNRNVSSQFSTT